MRRIAMGSDHGGYELKEAIKEHLLNKGIEVQDYGTSGTQSVDYTDFAEAVANAVANGKEERGILICGTGIGMSIAANKVPGIRAALCADCFSAKATREHNNSNILALGERVTGQGLAKMIVDIWMETEFLGGRHEARVSKITAIEQKYSKGGNGNGI